jgi:hypothetical protein
VIHYLFVFFGVIALDLVWARYIITTAEKRALRAAVNAALIMAITAIVTILYVSDPWAIIPATAGAFVGTYVSVWMQKRGW